MESTFHIRSFSKKTENHEIHILVQNSQNLELIKSLTWTIESFMIWHTIYQWWFNIRIRNHSCISSAATINFLEKGRKSGEINTEKATTIRIRTQNVPQDPKLLRIIALFTSLIGKGLNNHKELKFHDFGLKIRLLRSQKIKNSCKKTFFTGNFIWPLGIISYYYNIPISEKAQTFY